MIMPDEPNKTLQAMALPEVAELLKDIGKAVRGLSPDGTGYLVLLCPDAKTLQKGQEIIIHMATSLGKKAAPLVMKMILSKIEEGKGKSYEEEEEI